MRRPGFGRREIQRVFDKHHLGMVNRVSALGNSAINTCLLINDLYVLKVGRQELGLLPLKREALAFAILSKTDIPVPDVIALDDCVDTLPCPYIIVSRMHGRVLQSRWNRMKPDDRRQLSHEAGVLLGKIHEVRFPLFGDIDGTTFGCSSSWDHYILGEARSALAECEELCLMDRREARQILDLYERNREVFAEVRCSALVHNDFHLGNLMFAGKRITGTLDFEFAIAGDPEFDLKQMYQWYPQCEVPFLEGYCSVQSLSHSFRTKLPLYRLLLCIRLASVAKRFWKRRIQGRIREETSLLLRTLETLDLGDG